MAEQLEKELDEINDKRDLENAAREVELLGKSVERLRANLENQKRRKELHQQMHDIQVENYDLDEHGVRQYFSVPGYRELEIEFLKLTTEFKLQEYDKVINMLDSALIGQEEQLEQQKARLEEAESNE